MNPVFRFIYWNMNYHVEHHMFPMVPYHALPALHAEVADDLPVPYAACSPPIGRSSRRSAPAARARLLRAGASFRPRRSRSGQRCTKRYSRAQRASRWTERPTAG